MIKMVFVKFIVELFSKVLANTDCWAHFKAFKFRPNRRSITGYQTTRHLKRHLPSQVMTVISATVNVNLKVCFDNVSLR